MSYRHLSASERYQLYQHRKNGNLTMAQVAAQMNRSKSTISRELRRNSLDGAEYLPDSAHLKMRSRRQQSKQKFMSISASIVEEVKQRLQQYHSPEQVSGRMKRERVERGSHETVYQMIYANHQGLGRYGAISDKVETYVVVAHKPTRNAVGFQLELGLSSVQRAPMRKLKSSMSY
jgi:transposase, IS30 family